MKTFLLVTLSLLLLTTSSPESPKALSRLLTPAEAKTLLTSLAGADSSQATQVTQSVSTDVSQSLLEVHDLAALRQASLASQAGWLHIQTRNVQSHVDLLSPYATGLNQFVQDQWLALDDHGQVRQAVRKIADGSGNLLQVSRFEQGIWNNLTLGVQSQDLTIANFDPNYGFEGLAAGLVRQGYTLNKGLLYKECWYQGDKYTISDGHLLHEAVFDTGHQTLRWIKTWQVTPNGDVSLVDSLEVMVEERADQPPAEVEAIMEQALVSP